VTSRIAGADGSSQVASGDGRNAAAPVGGLLWTSPRLRLHFRAGRDPSAPRATDPKVRADRFKGR